jgi:Ca-activated chloride channel homolog
MKWSKTTLIFLLVAGSLNLCAQSPLTTGQQPDIEVLRVSTNLVTVPAIVKTRQGAYVPNLSREDFRIYEDGVEQEIASFASVDQPFTVALLLDMSDSLRIRLRETQDAALAFLKQLRPGDRALIVAFDKRFAVMTEATEDHKVLADGINRIKTGGGTPVYDTIDTIINSYMNRISGRKAIVILTDGVDTSSVRATYESTLRLATEQYALIYPIQFGTVSDAIASQVNVQLGTVTYTTPSGEPLSKAYERGTRYLQSLALTSGGRFQFSARLEDLEESFTRIAEELRQQYSLSYYPKNSNSKSGKRRIKVIVGVPDALVHSRASYAYKPDSR